jgi:hypothetical protein
MFRGVKLLEELSIPVDKSGRGGNEQPLISEHYKEITPLCHLVQWGNCPPPFNYTYESVFYEARISFDEAIIHYPIHWFSWTWFIG